MRKIPALLIALASSCAFIVPQAAIAGTKSSTAPWVKLGGVPGSDAGRIAFDPNNPNTMLVGPSSGGGELFRSTNGGTSFTRVQVGSIYECFRAIAFDPKKGSNIAFAFSSDNPNRGANGGVYKSTDDGATWTRLKAQPTPSGRTGNVGRGRGVLIDSTGTDVVLTDASFGIFYSADLGSSWTNTLPSSSAHAYALAADPKAANTIWAGGRDPSNGNNGVLWTSTNFGKSWTEVKIPALDQSSYPVPVAIAILPNSNTIIFGWSNIDNTAGGVIVSKDGGKTWANSTKGLPSNLNPGNAIVVDPVTPTTIYLTVNGAEYPNGLYRSTDSGATWTSLGSSLGGGDSVYTAAARPAGSGVTAAVFAGDQDLLSTTDHGATWKVSANGTNSAALNSVADDLLGAGGIYGAATNGLFHSADNGQTWTRISTSWTNATVPRAVAVDPVAKAHTVYASTVTAFWQSADAGKSWTAYALPAKATEIQSLIADTSVAGRVYAIDSTHLVYRSDNGGKSWGAGVAIGTASDSFASLPQVVADPGHSGTLFAGLGSSIWQSANSAQSWSTTAAVQGLASIAGTSLPGGTAIFATVAQASATTDTGQFFTLQKGLNGTMLSAAANPYPTNDGSSPFYLATAGTQLFAFGLDNSLMRSTNAAASWTLANGTIANSIVTASQASITAANIYVSDPVTDSAYVAPLSGLATSTMSARSPAKRSALGAGQSSRKVAE
jgi:hypothetical protein